MADSFAAVSEALARQEAAPTTQTQQQPGSTSNYADLFPALPTGPAGPSPAGAWGAKKNPVAGASALPKYKPSSVTEVLHMEAGDMQSTGFGDTRQAKIKKIMEQTGTKIEMSQNKVRGITFAISGKQEDVAKARKHLQTQFQAPKTVELVIPPEHYGAILGKEGSRLRELQDKHAVKINVPKKETGSNVVTITGNKEGVGRAALELQTVSDDRARQARELVHVERPLHPFVFGPNRGDVDTIAKMAGPTVKVHVPPPTVESDDVVVTGDKDEVAIAVGIINERLNAKRLGVKSLKVEIRKEQHKWLAGRKVLDGVFAETGVVVDLPAIDDPSESIVLRGDGDKLVKALQLVMEKAASMSTDSVPCPGWQQKYIIGAKGSGVAQLREGHSSDLKLDFHGDKNLIELSGPTVDIVAVKAALLAIVNDLRVNKARAEVHLDADYHRHIIGKGGQNVKRIKEETGVEINFPKEDEPGTAIIIEGPPAGVAKAKAEMEALVAKQKDARVVEVKIPQKFHGQVIGQKGDALQKLLEKYPGVNIKFPGNTEKSDVVRVSGPSKEVEGCVADLNKISNDLVENNYTLNVIVFRQYHRQVIGKGGANINKIRDATGTKITVPDEKEERDSITVVGRKPDVLKAQEMLLAIQAELVKISEVELKIDAKLHTQLIGPKGAVVRSISQDCNNVMIEFPKEGSSKPNIVTVRGPHDDVEKAKKMLMKLAEEKALVSHTETVTCAPELMGFLIGKEGANKKKIQDETETRLLFPGKADEEKSILIIGRRGNTLKAKEMLEALIKQLEERVTESMPITGDQHRVFYRNGSKLIKELQDEHAVNVSVARDKASVELRGPKEGVASAKAKVQEILDEMAREVTVEVAIAPEHYGSIMGKGGSRIQTIQDTHKVQVKFPRARGEAEASEEGETSEGHMVRISGAPENCEAAKNDLLALVPVHVTMDIPVDFHGSLIGRGGRGASQLRDDYGVTLKFPSASKESSHVTLIGPPQAVEEAKKFLESRLKEIEAERKDREARNHRLEVTVDGEMVPRIIGKGGQTINQIRNETGCNINIPKDKKEGPVTVTLVGYPAACEAAKAMIEELTEANSQGGDVVEDEIQVDHRVHGRLIGAGGKTVMLLSKELGVQIKFPRDKTSDVVTIKGTHVQVEAAKDRILDLAEEYLLEMEEEGGLDEYEYSAPKHEAPAPTTTPARQQAPDFHVDFPTMSQQAGTSAQAGSWTRRPGI
eukprot:comp21066_c0_seq1/m.28357 comp21066_c0_seq1/g.28357  ORF comp21066_c0_seq1/g.28357 comp21066_c0_seq1/m.28357 type:complete len:1230 (-) comp21066_c0_seq1:211-3900(-)